LLILTGQRRREVGNMPWTELHLDKRIWSLPSTRTKNHRADDVHLSGLAIEVIERLPRFTGQEYVFSVNGRQPVRGYSDAKKLINKRLAEVLPGMEGWVLHDLRRTVATGMANLGVAHEVLDRTLNHISGKIGPIARIYKRSQYAPERKAALDAWGRHPEALVYPERPQTNVVALLRAEVCRLRLGRFRIVPQPASLRSLKRTAPKGRFSSALEITSQPDEQPRPICVHRDHEDKRDMPH
jgi:hypothetical protein